MATETKMDPEAGLVGADGDGKWMEELLESPDTDFVMEGGLGELPSSFLTAEPWSNTLSTTVNEAGLGDRSTLQEESWGLQSDPLGPGDIDNMLKMLSSDTGEQFGEQFEILREDEDILTGGSPATSTGETCRVEIQESQESNRMQESSRVQEGTESSRGNSSRPDEGIKAEFSGRSPACSSGNVPFKGGVPGVKKEKESDSDSDNCTTERPVGEQGEVEKLQERLMRNRESAQLSRQRKKAYMEEMATRIRSLSTTVSELHTTIAHLSAENASLRHQLTFYLPAGTAPPLVTRGGAFMPPAAAPGRRPLYPALGPIAYGGYPPVMRPGYVPPVPIPRLPVQSATSTRKTGTKRSAAGKNKPKESADGTKAPAKKRLKLPSKAVAGISAMALFCFAMVVAPASWHATEIRAGTAVQPAGFEGFGATGLKSGGRVLMGLPEGNKSRVSSGTEMELRNETQRGRGLAGVGRGVERRYAEQNGQLARNGLVNTSLVWQQLVNASSPFQTSNRAWVAENRGMGSDENGRSKVPGVIPGVVGGKGDWIRNAVVAEARKTAGRIVAGVALGKGSKASRAALMTSSHERLQGIATLALSGRAETPRHAALPAADGTERFGRYSERETTDVWTFSGAPILSSGMCTELFQFSDPVVMDRVSDGKARTAAEAAAFAVARDQLIMSSENTGNNQTATLRGMGRKWKPKNPDAVPMPPVKENGTDFDTAHFGTRNASGRCGESVFGCDGKESSSVVVSVMVPQVGWEKASFGQGKGGKGWSQIFVVVLINSAKYVTYSCSVPTVA